MLAKQYLQGIRELLLEIEKEQLEVIDEAAQLTAQRVADGAVVHIFDNGHLLSNEAVGRAGGLMLMIPISFTITTNNPARERTEVNDAKMQISHHEEENLMKYLLDKSNLASGDVLIINSVSGKNVRPVELALEAKRRGVYVIAITSLTYSKTLKSLHSSGKRLFEVADIVIDNYGVVGDALLEVEGLEPKICPSSGVTAAVIIWMLTAQLVTHLLKLGITPSIYKSMNLEGAIDYNNKQKERYLEKGY